MSAEDKEVLRPVRNENRLDAEAYFKMGFVSFQGYWALLPILSAMLFMPLSLWCAQVGMDLGSMFVIGSLPFLASIIFVMVFVNNRAPSYGIDLVKTWLFKICEGLYLSGWMDRPPSLWMYKRRN